MSAVGPLYYTEEEEAEMEEEHKLPEVLYCLKEGCSYTAWDGIGRWEISVHRSLLIANGHQSRMAWCPSHTETRETPRFY